MQATDREMDSKQFSCTGSIILFIMDGEFAGTRREGKARCAND